MKCEKFTTQKILSPLRLPIPPHELFIKITLHRNGAESFLEAPPRFELGVKVLQTRALPLGYGAISAALERLRKIK